MLKALKSGLKTQLFLLIIIITAGLYHSVLADSSQDSNLAAAITVNLVRFSEWPSTVLKATDLNLHLCVLAENPMQQAFSEFDKKTANNRVLNVIYMSRIKNIEQCHIIYVGALDRLEVIQLLTEIGKKPVLTVATNQSDFLEDGGMVNLEVVDGKITLQINLRAVKQAGLNISSRVLKLATIINP